MHPFGGPSVLPILGLGCGNPQAIAALRTGETVIDLGSGAGFDCLLAAKRVGRTGRVIGVDMTPEMVTKARGNARAVGATNVEFRLGEIEHLPVPDTSVDAVLSNCVINLSPDKAAVFRETFRVLKPGGRLAISDVVAVKPNVRGVLLHLHLRRPQRADHRVRGARARRRSSRLPRGRHRLGNPPAHRGPRSARAPRRRRVVCQMRQMFEPVPLDGVEQEVRSLSDEPAP